MTSRDFCYWLQGYFELENPTEIYADTVEVMRRHLALVFKYEIDPQAGPPEVQKELNDIHSPTTSLTNRPPGMRC